MKIKDALSATINEGGRFQHLYDGVHIAIGQVSKKGGKTTASMNISTGDGSGFRAVIPYTAFDTGGAGSERGTTKVMLYRGKKLSAYLKLPATGWEVIA